MPAGSVARMLPLIRPCRSPTPEAQSGDQSNSRKASGYGSQGGWGSTHHHAACRISSPKQDEHRWGLREARTKPDTPLTGCAGSAQLPLPSRLHFCTRRFLRASQCSAIGKCRSGQPIRQDY
ncbi:hypothetical protein NDU88_000651 [Pleurodeles waltl]|uniref:Uncharacterized protein n=1 Tax=Pleurodeles waltl TaxID=8319 RepID=A0AAV7VXJ3_PLEWA|nr:hypothetical protein NDU88_000651 [Pleurodeles waltl]